MGPDRRRAFLPGPLRPRRDGQALPAQDLGLDDPLVPRLGADVQLRAQGPAGGVYGRIVLDSVQRHADGTLADLGGYFLGM